MRFEQVKSWITGKETRIFYLFIICYLSLLAFCGINRPDAWHDEDHFVETIKYFGENLNFRSLYDYEEMSTPLPFIVYAIWGKFVGFGLPNLRIFSILTAFCTYLIFYSFFKSFFNKLTAILAVAFFAINPYSAGISLFVFTDMLAILSLGLSLLSVIKRRPVLLGIGLSASLLSRQYLAFLIPPFFLFYALKLLYSKDIHDLKSLIAVVLSCIPFGLLVLYWGGTCPDNICKNNYVSYAFVFHPEFLTLYISQIFIYTFPFVLYHWKKYYFSTKIILISILTSAFYFLFPVKTSIPGMHANVLTVGYFHRFLKMFLNDGTTNLVFYFAFLLALPVFFTFLSDIVSDIRAKKFDIRFLSVCILICFLIVMPFSYLVWEKYFLPVLPIVIFLILYDGGRKTNAEDLSRI